MGTLYRCLTVAACALAVSSSAMAAPDDDQRRKYVAPLYDTLQHKAAVQGKVRVIVRVREDYVSDASTRVSRAHTRAIQFAKQQKQKPRRVLHQQGLQSYELTQTEIDTFIDSNQFTHIVEDKLNAPSLLQSIPFIGTDAAHAAGLTGSGVAIAILDTGVEALHNNFGGRVVKEACFSSTFGGYDVTTLCPNGQETQYGPGAAAPCNDLCYHGTHVASIAAGDDHFVTGVAPDADIIAVQVFSLFENPDICDPLTRCVRAFDSDTIAALSYVESLTQTHIIAAVNLSLGGGYYTSACDGAAHKGVIDALAVAGVATVAAAGNDGYTDAINSPACISTVISVSSVSDTNNTVHSFSNSANILDILAPGGAITAAYTGGQYATLNGTSMATPHIAGVFALLRSEVPGMTVAEAKSLLTSEATTVVDARNGLAFPRLDMTKVLAAMRSTPTLMSEDSDDDGIADGIDNCPEAPNPTQLDFDQDGIGYHCDLSPGC
jgi:subtilisin family serine protease